MKTYLMQIFFGPVYYFTRSHLLISCFTGFSKLKKIQDISQKEDFFYTQVRINQELEHFLINPFGLNYGEITASSLVKVDMQGDVIEKGTTTLGINRAGFTLHSAIHQARPDLKCVIHLHTPAAVAVSPSPVLVDSVFNQCCTGNDFKGRVNWHWYMSRVYNFIKRNSNKLKTKIAMFLIQAYVALKLFYNLFIDSCMFICKHVTICKMKKKYHCTCTGINIWYFCCRCLH